MALFGRAFIFLLAIYITGVQSVKEITSLDVEIYNYRDLGLERDVAFAVGNLKIKLCSPVRARPAKPYPLVMVEIFALEGGNALDRIIMTKESFDFESGSDDKTSSESFKIANLLLIPLNYPLRATLKVDQRYKEADCIRRTYTDQTGVLLAKFREEVLSDCPF